MQILMLQKKAYVQQFATSGKQRLSEFIQRTREQEAQRMAEKRERENGRKADCGKNVSAGVRMPGENYAR